MIIPLFFVDFRIIVRSQKFGSPDNVHPVFYYDEQDKTCFYKPIGSVLYTTEVSSKDLKDITIQGIKDEFSAIELPKSLSSVIKQDKEIVKPKQ